MEMLQQVFQGQCVRATEEQGKSWVVAKDVAEALGISWTSRTLDSIKPEWKGVMEFITPGGVQQLTVITEPAIYKLAFRSRKAEAEAFTDWVAGDLLPTLRRQGFIDLRKPVITRAGLKHATRLQANDIVADLRRHGVYPIGFAEDATTGFAEPVFDMLAACRVFRWDFVTRPYPYRGLWTEGPLQPELAARATEYKMTRRTARSTHAFGLEHDWEELPEYVQDWLKPPV